MEASTYRLAHLHGIGSGEIAAVAGLSRWKSRLDVWSEKTGLAVVDGEVVETPPPPPRDPNAEGWAAMRGQIVEPALHRLLELRTGLEWPRRDPPEAHGAWARSSTHPLVLATPDAWRPGEAVGEVKDVGVWTATDWGDDGTGSNGVPGYVLPQLTWEMHATETPLAYCGAYVDKFLRVYRVDYNARLFAELHNAAEDFWRYVVDCKPPPADGSTSAHEWLQRAYPTSRKAEPIEAVGENLDFILRRFLPAYETAKAAEKALEQLEPEMKQRIAHGGGFIGAWGSILYRNDSKGGVAWKKAWEELAARYETLAAELAEHERRGVKRLSPDELAGAMEFGAPDELDDELDGILEAARSAPKRPLKPLPAKGWREIP